MCWPIRQLFDVIVRDELLQNVIRSMTRNGRALLMTAALGLILMHEPPDVHGDRRLPRVRDG